MIKVLLGVVLVLCAAGCGNAPQPAASHDVVFDEPVVIEGHPLPETLATRP